MVETDYMALALKNKNHIMMIFIIIVASVISSKIYKGQMVKYEKIKSDIKIEQEKRSALDRLVIVNEELKKIKLRSWDVKDTNLVIEKIYDILSGTKIKIKNLMPKDKVDEKNYILLPFSLAFETTYAEFFGFLKKVETFPMAMMIKDLRVASPERNGASKEEPLLGVDLTMQAVYLK